MKEWMSFENEGAAPMDLKRFQILNKVVFLASAGLLLTTAAGRLESFGWPWENFVHFPVTLFWYAWIPLVAALVLRLRVATLICLLVLGVNGALLWPYFQTAQAVAAPADGVGSFRVAWGNIYLKNERPGALNAALAARDADVVVLGEVTWELDRALNPLAAAYPNVLRTAKPGSFGLVLLSRFPILSHRVIHYGSEGLATLAAEIGAPGGPITLMGAHLRAPFSYSWARLRDMQLDDMAQLAAESPRPVLFIGDCNTTPWSAGFVRFLEKGGLRDSAESHGVSPSFPSWGLGVGLGIPIDHAATTRGVRISKRRTFSLPGSDHAGLEVVAQVTGYSPGSS